MTFASAGRQEAVSRLREAFDESALPFRVGLFVWDNVPEEFRKNIEETRVVVQEKKHSKNPPNNWKILTLSKIINLIGGGTPKRSKQAYWNGNIPWLSVKDFNNQYRYVDSAEETITELGEQESSTRVLKTGQLIISARGTVGALAQLTQPMAFNQSCYGIDAKREYTDNDFLYYLVKHSIDNLKQITHGAVFDTITRETFNHIEVSLPPPPEQKAIAHILGSLDDKIELNRRMNETLEAMAQAMFKSWFVDFDPVIDNALAAGNTIPDELKEKACLRRSLGRQAAIRQGLDDKRKSLPDDIRRLFPSEFAYTEEMGWIPKGWEMLSVGEVSSCFDNKRTPLSRKQRECKQPGTIPYYGATSIMDYINEYIFNDIFLLIGEDGSVVKEDGSPFTQYIWGQTWVNNHAHVLQGAFGISTEHLMLFLQSQNIRSYTTGAVQLKINQKNMNSIPFLFAANRINKSFASIIDPLYERIRKISESNKKLYKIQATLLPRLLSGVIRVPNFDSAYGGKND